MLTPKFVIRRCFEARMGGSIKVSSWGTAVPKGFLNEGTCCHEGTRQGSNQKDVCIRLVPP